MMKIRCAVIGCGRIGCGFDDNSNIIRTHAGSYHANKTTSLVSLCDVDESKLAKYGKKYRVSSLYTDSLEMFKNEKIDCVSICTLVDTHLELVKHAAKNNVKAIFLEKPISDSLVNAKKIIEICRSNKIKLAVDHQRRFNPFYQSLRRVIEQKKLGKIQFVNAYYGSGIANTGSHLFDVLRLFFGEIVSIISQPAKTNTINPADPNIDAAIRFKTGATCQLHALDYGKYAILEIDILGTLGRIKLDLISDQIQYFKTTKGLVYNTLAESKLNLKKPNKTPIQHAIQNLIETITSSKEPLCTGYDGYKSIEMIAAATLSSKYQKQMNLPLKNNYKITSK